MKQSTRKQIEEKLKKVIPKDCAGDFNQGLIELGAIVCVPNGEPKCEECPAAPFCQARIRGKIQELPVKEKAKARRIEKKTVLILRDEDKIAICKRTSGRTLRTPEHRRTLEQKRDNTVLQRDWTHADSHKKIARSKTHFQPHRMADDRI